ncbi:cysteine-rich protein 2-binding protein [Bacillus rossius redtenbacheri]|uniref:cysteine-rich protein 2-binding protein n=1 Tax=Bacillus rossius redtenbacheri TaxID=93214 RepID=UPI002FDE5D14
MSVCRYCALLINVNNSPYFTCGSCNLPTHSDCLKTSRFPSTLLGDVFFNFTCEECSPVGNEEFTRNKLSWLSVVVIALYNLHKRSIGLSHKGYFHWKLQICGLINKNWNQLFGNVVKKKNWMGTVSGILSHYSPKFFHSGTEDLNELGWWKLTQLVTPQAIMQQYSRLQQDRKKVGAKVPESGSSSQGSTSPASSSARDSSLSAFDDASSVEFGLGDVSMPLGLKMFQNSYLGHNDLLLEHLFDGSLEDDCSDVDVDVDVDVEDSRPLSLPSSSYSRALSQMDSFLLGTYQDPFESCSLGRGSSVLEPLDGGPGLDADVEDVCEDPPVVFSSPSLITVRKTTTWPWEKEEKPPDNGGGARCMPASVYEEHQLLSRLHRVPEVDAPGPVRRLHRKLCVRRLKRERGLPLFDLDRGGYGSRERRPAGGPGETRVLDRFQVQSRRSQELGSVESRHCSFMVRLMGQSEPMCFCSPYTHRLLKPYIWRDGETTPLWLKLMQEVQARANESVPGWSLPPRAPIDYSYVRPEHIPYINRMACEFFYPGIDLTECLQYPDFSCVVLYKKLVVGFAFMVPDVGYNEAYISFLFTRPEWRRAGIATFMLYHLIQTCMGRDVTLHVSATNPAIILYQKFGFKVEEFVQDFYDKYFPMDCKDCRHAFFLRLSR